LEIIENYKKKIKEEEEEIEYLKMGYEIQKKTNDLNQ